MHFTSRREKSRKFRVFSRSKNLEVTGRPYSFIKKPIISFRVLLVTVKYHESGIALKVNFNYATGFGFRYNWQSFFLTC